MKAATTVDVEVYMYSGSGAFGLALFSDSNKVIPAGIHKIGGDGDGFIQNRIRQLYAQFSRKKIPVSPLLKGRLRDGDSVDFDVELEKGCVTLIGVGGPAVAGIRLSLHAADGRMIGEKAADTGFVWFDGQICPLEKGVYRVTVVVTEGNGVVGAQLYTK